MREGVAPSRRGGSRGAPAENFFLKILVKILHFGAFRARKYVPRRWTETAKLFSMIFAVQQDQCYDLP